MALKDNLSGGEREMFTMTRSVSRVFLQAWTIFWLDPEGKNVGRANVGGLSDQLLINRIREYHLKLYPGAKLEWREVRTFLKYERNASNGVVRGTARDNFVRWENISPEIMDVRTIISQRLAKTSSAEFDRRHQGLSRDGDDEVLRMLGLR